MSGKPRKTPCTSCPYRRDVPSGVWAASEYAKLQTTTPQRAAEEQTAKDRAEMVGRVRQMTGI